MDVVCGDGLGGDEGCRLGGGEGVVGYVDERGGGGDFGGVLVHFGDC
jgi:hypothetical protein